MLDGLFLPYAHNGGDVVPVTQVGKTGNLSPDHPIAPPIASAGATPRAVSFLTRAALAAVASLPATAAFFGGVS